ncbi:DUF803-domain-containing protein [Lichtheimia hyalospora FSU 10163]|nr:DUF803-domain-containing protein [Lichtheimia hyalospora FSU 10163]
MSEPTNSTTDPFASGASDAAHGSLYKAIGLSLAIGSSLFIGSSFVFKKKGLLQSMGRTGRSAGEGYGYLKNVMWWAGMILMIVGELCNFVAYSFAPAILVTPLGALSVVISAVLSSFFLKERLNFQGKVGCVQCILGAVVIVLHAPEEGTTDTTIENFKRLMLSVGFLVYAGIAVIVSLVLVFYCGPRWGKTNMLVYIGVCSWIGSLSVVFTQGLGSAIVHSFTIENQFTNWFIYLVLALTVVTLVLEIVYLNKALNIFNTAVVTPTYYVLFTTLTIVSATVLYRGFDASGVDITTCVFGFLVICSGVALLHYSRSGNDLDDGASSIDSRRKSLLHTFMNEKVSYEDRHSMDQVHEIRSFHDDEENQMNPFRTPDTLTVNDKEHAVHSTSLETIDIQPIDPPPSAKGHRAQDAMDPLSAFRMGLHRDNDEDNKGLVASNNSRSP